MARCGPCSRGQDRQARRQVLLLPLQELRGVQARLHALDVRELNLGAVPGIGRRCATRRVSASWTRDTHTGAGIEVLGTAACAQVLRPSWRILARLSSTPNALSSFPLLTRKM